MLKSKLRECCLCRIGPTSLSCGSNEIGHRADAVGNLEEGSSRVFFLARTGRNGCRKKAGYPLPEHPVRFHSESGALAVTYAALECDNRRPVSEYGPVRCPVASGFRHVVTSAPSPVMNRKKGIKVTSLVNVGSKPDPARRWPSALLVRAKSGHALCSNSAPPCLPEIQAQSRDAPLIALKEEVSFPLHPSFVVQVTDKR